MIDFSAFIISLFLIFFLFGVIVLIIWVGVKFFYSLVTVGQSSGTYDEETDNQPRQDSNEDAKQTYT